MGNGTVLVLGSGSTLGGGFQVEIRGTRFEPPLDRNFFESPAVQSILSPDCYPAVVHYRQGPGLEATWAKIDLLLKLCLSGVVSEEHTSQLLKRKMDSKTNHDGQIDKAYQQKMQRESCHSRVPSMAEWELRSLTREVYCDLCCPQPLQESPLHKLITALWKENMLRGIISFNYDTSVEKLFDEQFYYPLFQVIGVDGKLPLMKLHGSLNWQESPPVIQPVPGVAEMHYQNGVWKQPAVIGPTFFKQEITIDCQRDYRAMFYKKLWRFAWDALRIAQNLIFVGFSLPQTDFHATALFRTAHLRCGGFRRVLLCHRGDQLLRDTAERVFDGGATEFIEFDRGLEDMAKRGQEVTALLH